MDLSHLSMPNAVVVVDTHNAMYEKIMSNIQEIKARKGKVIALVTEGDTVISKLAYDCIDLPETLECLEPLIATVPYSYWLTMQPFAKGRMWMSHEIWRSR